MYARFSMVLLCCEWCFDCQCTLVFRCRAPFACLLPVCFYASRVTVSSLVVFLGLRVSLRNLTVLVSFSWTFGCWLLAAGCMALFLANFRTFHCFRCG